MDIQLIADQVKIINTRLEALEYYYTYFTTDITEKYLRCTLSHRGLKDDDCQFESWTFNFDGDYNDHDSIGHMFVEINDSISNMPTGDNLKKRSLVRLLEEVKLRTEDLDINVDIVNPFITIMNELATNAITHRKSTEIAA
tara:strand:+ start:296 stop:718 length:423 start_codon:yes stop_codon:yes gene_type:complete